MALANRRKYTYRRCWVPNCPNRNNRNAAKTKVFAFPRNVHRCRKWLKLIGDPGLAQTKWKSLVTLRFVCKRHFLPNKITPQNRVTEDALPLIFEDERPPLSEEYLAIFDANIPEDRRPKDMCLSESERQLALTAIMHHNYVKTSTEDSEEVEGAKQSSKCARSETMGVSHVTIEIPWKTEGGSIKIEDNEYGDDVQTFDDNIVNSCCNSPTLALIDQGENFRWKTAEEQALEDEKKILCRICGKRNQLLKPIHETSLIMQVEKYLPIKVSPDDALPPNVCCKCTDMLHQWHTFYGNCLSADTVFRKVFHDSQQTKETTKSASRLQTFVNNSVLGEGSASVTKGQTLEDNAKFSLQELSQFYAVSELPGASKGSEYSGDDLLSKDKPNYSLDTFMASCGHCNELFYCTSDCNTHVNECQELPALCDLCGKEVPHRKHLNEHRKQHSKSENTRVICAKCCRTKLISQSHPLQTVLSEPHGDQSLTFYCKKCLKVKFYEAQYQLHLKNHSAEGIICTQFKLEPNLKGVDTTVYVCPVCGKTFGDEC